MSDMLLAGTFPLPPSVNESYFTDKKGIRRLTYRARDYKDALQQRLSHGQIEPPYHLYLNTTLLQEIQQAIAAHPDKRLYQYRLDCLYVFANQRRDLDNGNKLFQDALFAWLGENDNRLIFLQQSRYVCATSFPHVECILRLSSVEWFDGALWDKAQRELALPQQYDWCISQ